MFALRLVPSCAIAFACCAFAPAVRADTSDVIAAEALFRSGKDLLAQKDYAHACPKLAESYRLDPATGTLLALAICHERQGKLASAWGEYADAASRSRVESRIDRETAARGKAAELEAEVSTLTITLSDGADTKGLEIKRNGVVIAPAWFGTPVPFDGGTLSIDASAPGKKPRHIEVALAPSGERKTVTIAPLDDMGSGAEHGAAATPSTSAAPAQSSTQGPADGTVQAASARGGLSPLQVTGLVGGVCGAIGLGVGGFFAVQAINKNNASQPECQGTACTKQGKQDRDDAFSSGNLATAALLGGGALIAAGAVLYLSGVGSRERSETDRHTSLRVLPTGSDRGFGGVLQGTF